MNQSESSIPDGEIVGIYAYGNFGQHAGSDPTSQAAQYKSWLDAIGKAGFNVLVMSTFHIDSEGNLHDTAKLVTNGTFNPDLTSDPTQALNPQLSGLLSDFKSKYNAKVYYSIGNWDGTIGDVTNLKALLKGYSCDPEISLPTSPYFQNLVDNLNVLKSNLPIDGVDMDFEPNGVTFDSHLQHMISQFTCLLYDNGYGVTYCPYTNTDLWMKAQADACTASANDGTVPTKVNWWNLQCYGNGTADSYVEALAAYDKANPNQLGISDVHKFVISGYNNEGNQAKTSAEVETALKETATAKHYSNGGGWVWQLGQFLPSTDLETELAKYSSAIVNGCKG